MGRRGSSANHVPISLLLFEKSKGKVNIQSSTETRACSRKEKGPALCGTAGTRPALRASEMTVVWLVGGPREFWRCLLMQTLVCYRAVTDLMAHASAKRKPTHYNVVIKLPALIFFLSPSYSDVPTREERAHLKLFTR